MAIDNEAAQIWEVLEWERIFRILPSSETKMERLEVGKFFEGADNGGVCGFEDLKFPAIG